MEKMSLSFSCLVLVSMVLQLSTVQHSSRLNYGTFFSVGEYFLAELIESQDSSHQTIVAEVEGRAVGFMSISSEVDVEFLNDCYQLEPFHGLKQPLDTDEVQTISTEG